ncbi:hypothetical protein A374_15032 [Fictibacillus macauensis ZFHKF-1]|uniref:Uncharacterized protein n=1 Tax=Fictibacillus macauensis ZFHKF-1 TaxID=1196324 RepID=I8UC28_9BACL|nr:hypothetical protein [Fictibacillus macauensis]EIT84450.1 hypothetical protein A374_15032 [Fictibacillus macauensis ZFHKF-1]
MRNFTYNPDTADQNYRSHAYSYGRKAGALSVPSLEIAAGILAFLSVPVITAGGAFGTVLSGGTALPFVIAADTAVIGLGVGLISHGGYNLYNAKDTLQRIDRHNVKPEVSANKGTVKYNGGRTQKELDDLAGDPSHGGRIEGQGIKEREIGLELESRGDLGRIIRDQKADKGAEFIDTVTEKKGDVKSFESYPNGHTSPKKGAFTVDNAMKKIKKEFERGHNVILDDRNLTPEHTKQLKEAIQKEGISDKIIWYP